MTTIGTIKAAVRQYLQVNFPSANEPQAGSGLASVNEAAAQELIMLALNNARKYAELRHDWRGSEVRVRATITSGSKVSFSGLEDFYDDTITHDIKSPNFFFVEGTESGVLNPIEFQTARGMATQFRDIENATGDVDLETRYRGDLPVSSVDRLQKIVAIGEYFYAEPKSTESINVVIDGYAWLDDYKKDADTDFFVQRGSAYLMYAAMCEANYLWKTFVIRQEGNVSPPTGDRDRELQALIDWDTYAVENAVAQDLS